MSAFAQTERAGQIWKTQGRILLALILRDIHTRFFGHGLGYLIAIAWPLTHIVVLLIVFSLGNRAVPYGDNMTLFLATGVIPFMTFNYMSRFTMYSAAFNRPLLSFPTVKVMDILIARAILEFLSSCCTVILVLAVLWLVGIDFVPHDTLQAIYGMGACMLLGFGYGIINGVIAMAARAWLTGYQLAIICLYLTSGIMFVPDAVPAQLRYFLWFNPILQGIEWVRSAYYDGYGANMLDKEYAIACGVLAVFFGLLVERLVRGRILQQ